MKNLNAKELTKNEMKAVLGGDTPDLICEIGGNEACEEYCRHRYGVLGECNESDDCDCF